MPEAELPSSTFSCREIPAPPHPLEADRRRQDVAGDTLHSMPSSRSVIAGLRARFPDNWFLETAFGTFLVNSSEAAEVQEGERILRACVGPTPDCPTAHLTLGTALKYQNRREEAMALFEDAVSRWPWHNQTVDSCLGLLTDGMTAAAS